MTDKNNKNSSFPGANAVGLAIIAAVCFCAVFVVFRAIGVGSAAESEDAKNGAQYISSIEDRDVADISKKENKSIRQKRAKKAAELLEGLNDGSIDVWTLFNGVAVIGDSRAEAFTGYEYLPETIVFAKKGANLRAATEAIDEVTAAQPGSLVFTYGINDITGNWKSSDDFIEKYKEVIAEYKSRLPDADIYVCSIIPVTGTAISDDPTLEQLPDYAYQVERMCEEEGYIYTDCDSVYDYTEYYEGDGIHFTKKMYPIWGELIIRKVLTYESERFAEDSD